MKKIPKERNIYHHWRYDPSTDEAFLDPDEAENSGYAYYIDGGWRLTDRDHDTVDDPYIYKKVLDVLRDRSPSPDVPGNYNTSKLHYGRPVLVKKVY